MVAAAVILPRSLALSGIADSKRLSAQQRADLAEALCRDCDYGIGMASVEEIDRLNILSASLRAMQRAVARLSRPPDLTLVDGPYCPALPNKALPLIKGDRRCRAIAAAAIVAKIHRDALMRGYAEKYPGYGWESNAGYGTKTHRDGLQKHGITPLHRISFAPVRRTVIQQRRHALT